jgi:hypothetical protein
MSAADHDPAVADFSVARPLLEVLVREQLCKYSREM